MDNEPKESIVRETHDPLINLLRKLVVICVKCLAVMMVLVIYWALIDVIVHLYDSATHWSNTLLFSSENLISIFGSFLVVLIAIEIFLNIVFYLKQDAIHVPLVLATALTAVSRKVIIFDYSSISTDFIYATSAAVIAIGLCYWLITKESK